MIGEDDEESVIPAPISAECIDDGPDALISITDGGLVEGMNLRGKLVEPGRPAMIQMS